MTRCLEQLAFRSGSADLNEALSGLHEILTEAQTADRTTALTGAIAVSGARYLQVLEGDADVIAATVARIDTDPRHRSVHVVSRRPVATRSFEAWALASSIGLPSLKLQIDLAVASCEADFDQAIALLKGVVTSQRHQVHGHAA